MRRIRQFSLATMLLATVVVAGALALWRGLVRPVVEQQGAVRVLLASDGKIATQPTPWSWRHLILDDATRVEVISVDLSPAWAEIRTDRGGYPVRSSAQPQPLPTIDASVRNALPVVSGLTSLNLAETDVGDEIAPLLARLSTLKELDLRGTRIGDGTVAVLSRLPHLETLHLGATAVTADAVDSIKAMPTLRTIGLAKTMEARLAELAEIPTLRHVFVASKDFGLLPRSWTDSSIERVDQLERMGANVWNRTPWIPVLPTHRPAREFLLGRPWMVTGQPKPDQVAERWRALAEAEGLTELIAPPGPPSTIPEDAFAGLAELESVTFEVHVRPGTPFDLSFHENQAEEMAALARLPNLREITLFGAMMQSPKVYTPLASVERLERLTVSPRPGLPEMAPSPWAELIRNEVGNAVVMASDPEPFVASACLPAFVADTPDSVRANTYQIWPKGQLSADAASAIPHFPRLHLLHINSDDLTLEAIPRLGESSLRAIHVQGGVSREQAEALAALPSLTYLKIDAAQLSDSLADDVIRPFLGPTAIEHIMVTDAAMTSERAAALLDDTGHAGPWSMATRKDGYQPSNNPEDIGQAVELAGSNGPRWVAFATADMGARVKTVDPNVRLADLRSLDQTLHRANETTDQDLAATLQRAERVESVKAWIHSADGALAEALGSRPHLRTIDLLRTGKLSPQSDEDRPEAQEVGHWIRLGEALASVDSLERVRLVQRPLESFTASDFASLARIPNLQTVWIEGRYSHEALKELAERRSLEWIILPGCRPVGWNNLARWNAFELGQPKPEGSPPKPESVPLARYLTAWPRLEVLMIPGLPLDELAVERLAAMPTLEILWVNGSQLTPEQAKPLRELPQLRRLALADCTWSDNEKQAFASEGPRSFLFYFHQISSEDSMSRRQYNHPLYVLDALWEVRGQESLRAAR